MSKLFRLFAITLTAVLAFTACEKVGGDTAQPTIEIVAVSATDTTFSFAVTTTDAKECAYVLYDGDIISADRVLSEGTAIDASGVVEVKNLKADTAYYLVEM